MNKEEYLNRLKMGLVSLPEVYSEEILKDYESHFAEGIMAGKSEEEIAANLGDVNYIIKEIITEYYTENSHEIKDTKSAFRVLFTLANVGIGTLNLLVIAPLVLSICIVVFCLYLVAYLFLLTPVFFVLRFIFPNIIRMGTGTTLSAVITTLICLPLGYFLNKLLKKYSKTFFKWVTMYAIRTVKFKMLKSQQ